MSRKKRRGVSVPPFSAVNQISASVFSRYSHPVKEKALHTVVSITALEDSVPSWPILRAMLKQLTVAGEASMTNIATSTSPRQPSHTAVGRNNAAKITSLNRLHTRAGFQHPTAFRGSMDAPRAMSPMGVAVAAKLEIARFIMTG